MLEVEVKAKVNIDEVADKLAACGFARGTTVYELDTYYNGVIDLKAEDKALRIRVHRDVDSGVTRYVLNFKGPKLDNITMTREETQFDIPDFKSGEIIINGLGYTAAGKVEKTRIHYSKDDITCCLDTVTGLGDFLEVEIMAGESDYDRAVMKVEALLTILGINMQDTVRKSYLSMLEDIHNKS